jgi:L,D-transpeptidase ErfK/SrfK
VRLRARLVVCVLALLATPAAAQQTIEAAVALVGGRIEYEVKTGDTVGSIAARFAVARATLIEMNQLTSPYTLAAGRILIVDNTHIALANIQAGITINIPQRLLVLVEGERLRVYPITVGKRDWPTPVGAFTVLTKETDPVWDVPLSIQREMEQQGKPVITRMEASPQNPLGRHWIGLSFPSLGIHGTNQPSSIYAFASHGCIRMHPDDVASLFERVTIGMTGVLVYQPVVVAEVAGRIWLEAHPDTYRRAPDAMRMVRGAAERAGLTESIDLALVEQVIAQRRGRAVDITLSPR